MRFVRKNALVCSGSFLAADGGAAQPANAELVVAYQTASGPATATIPLSISNNVWEGVWDSSAAVSGRVDWMVHCWNGLVAATQGSFEIVANAANTA